MTSGETLLDKPLIIPQNIDKTEHGTTSSDSLWNFCQACLRNNTDNLKNMMESHPYDGDTEVYSEMLDYCFALQVEMSHRERSETIYLICESCIKRLREVVSFRRQVEDAQKNIRSKLLAMSGKAHVPLKYPESNPNAESSDSDVNYFGIEDQHLLSFLDDEDLSSDNESTPERQPVIREIQKINNTTPKETNRKSLRKMRSCGNSTLNVVKKLSMNNRRSKKINGWTHRPIKIEPQSITAEKTISSDEDVSKCEESMEAIEEALPIVRISSTYHHLPYVLEKNQLECKICHMNFESHRHLQIHMPEHFPNFYCTHCGRGFANRAQLTRHESIHSQERFECPQCPGKLFKTKLSQQEHVKRKHSDNPGNHRCPHCDDHFTSYYDRQKHLMKVHGETKKRRELKCKLCTKIFSTPSHRSIHYRRVHLNERKHACQTCGKVFFANQCLRRHMVMHTQDKLFECSICQKTFQRKYTLTVHLKTHKVVKT